MGASTPSLAVVQGCVCMGVGGWGVGGEIEDPHTITDSCAGMCVCVCVGGGGLKTHIPSLTLVQGCACVGGGGEGLKTHIPSLTLVQGCACVWGGGG